MTGNSDIFKGCFLLELLWKRQVKLGVWGDIFGIYKFPRMYTDYKKYVGAGLIFWIGLFSVFYGSCIHI